jgi:2-haloacid dehalogenase
MINFVAMKAAIHNLIFDLGAVLIDWNPRYLYRQLFESEEGMEHFLEKVCTSEWNEEQDGGREISVAQALLIDQFPEYSAEILAFYGRWTEMLGGDIAGTVAILRDLKNKGQHGLFALTNWSAETWPMAVERFDFLNWFDGILVSGQEKMRKPDPRIYMAICEKHKLQPAHTLFIDDNQRNILAAQDFGLQTIHFTNPKTLAEALNKLL